MDELLQAVTALIKDGLNWQETIVSCFLLITIGFSIWVVVSGMTNVIRVAIIAIEKIIISTFKGIKTLFNSLANGSSNQPPKI